MLACWAPSMWETPQVKMERKGQGPMLGTNSKQAWWQSLLRAAERAMNSAGCTSHLISPWPCRLHVCDPVSVGKWGNWGLGRQSGVLVSQRLPRSTLPLGTLCPGVKTTHGSARNRGCPGLQEEGWSDGMALGGGTTRLVPSEITSLPNLNMMLLAKLHPEEIRPTRH